MVPGHDTEGGMDADTVTDALLTASRLLVAVSARSIASVDDSITLPQYRLLVVLFNYGPLKLATLAEHLGVNPSTATRMIDRLIATRLASRQVNPSSRREVVVELTEAGAGVVSEATSRRREEIAGIVARMPDRRRRDLVAALEAFADAGGEPAATMTPADEVRSLYRI
ncbi:MAG TPA: MarR family transcriptional regulator [Pseudonocardiaceae bacterium]|nr:MarR family transcriptional regulator [Pseudonocardiaceae bacterium]